MGPREAFAIVSTFRTIRVNLLQPLHHREGTAANAPRRTNPPQMTGPFHLPLGTT